MSNSSSNGYGCGTTALVNMLTVAFVVLKLCGVITWSWWWVLSPIWISAGLGILILIVLAILWFAGN